MTLTLTSNSRVATGAAAIALVAGLGLSALAQGTTQTGGQQGRAGGAGGGQAQQPTRDTQAQAQVPATGVIAGVVTVDGAGTPVRRARVTANAPELRGGRSTITDDQGKFSLTALPAGRFTITASKAGYIDIPYGAKKAGRPGTPIQLAAGQKMEKANIAIPKGGVITGVVVDDNGEPTPRAQIRVMKYVMRTGEKTLQQSGTDMTDDRGIYRVYGLLPGDYLVSAIPQNQNIGDLRQTVMAEVESLLQQAQAGGLGALAGGGAGGGGGRGAGGGGGRGGAAGAAGIDLQAIMGGRGGGQGGAFLAQAQQLQEQLAQQEGAQPVAYAPVYYPGTPTPSAASPVTLAVAEERNGVDFRLMLVPTAKVTGSVTSPDGQVPQGTQISLVPLDQANTPPVPGMNTNTTRLGQDGKFTFRDIPPGRYRAMARGAVRDPNAPVDPNGRGGRGGPGGQGPGGRGGPGQVSQVLWGSADIDVNGQDVGEVAIALQEGMTIKGRILFDGSSALLPTDLSTTRINLSPRGAQQTGDIGFVPQATVDAQGNFTIKGVLPGKYSLNAGIGGGGGARAAGAGGAAAGGAAGGAAAAGGRGGGGRGGGGAAPAATGATGGATTQWILKSVAAGGKDALDFGLVIEPNQDVTATITFGDKTQGLTGTIQDTLGNPTSDYTIILFAADEGYWVPQARRIQSVRPGTDGKFSFSNLPVGDYRLTAVTDVEPGEWFDPAFLEQLVSASIAVNLKEGEKKTQDMKVAGG